MFLLIITNNSIILYIVYSAWSTDKDQFGNVALWKKKVVHHWYMDLCVVQREVINWSTSSFHCWAGKFGLSKCSVLYAQASKFIVLHPHSPLVGKSSQVNYLDETLITVILTYTKDRALSTGNIKRNFYMG